MSPIHEEVVEEKAEPLGTWEVAWDTGAWHLSLVVAQESEKA